MILAHFFSYLPKAVLKFRLHVSKFCSMKACCVLFFQSVLPLAVLFVCVFLPPTPSAFWAPRECQAKLGQVSHPFRHKVLSAQLIFPRSFPPAEASDSGGITLEVKSTGISWAGIDFFFSFFIWHCGACGVVHVCSYQKLTEIHSEQKNRPFSQCSFKKWAALKAQCVRSSSI